MWVGEAGRAVTGSAQSGHQGLHTDCLLEATRPRCLSIMAGVLSPKPVNGFPWNSRKTMAELTLGDENYGSGLKQTDIHRKPHRR